MIEECLKICSWNVCCGQTAIDERTELHCFSFFAYFIRSSLSSVCFSLSAFPIRLHSYFNCFTNYFASMFTHTGWFQWHADNESSVAVRSMCLAFVCRFWLLETPVDVRLNHLIYCRLEALAACCVFVYYISDILRSKRCCSFRSFWSMYCCDYANIDSRVRCESSGETNCFLRHWSSILTRKTESRVSRKISVDKTDSCCAIITKSARICWFIVATEQHAAYCRWMSAFWLKW